MVNIHVDVLRKGSHEVPTADLELTAPEPAAPSPLDHIGMSEIMAALENVPEPFREAFVMFHLRGIDQTTIAKHQGTRRDRVSKRVAAARLRLRDLLLGDPEKRT